MSILDPTEKIRKVEVDLAAGLKTRAINRLQGLINAYPSELVFREKLAEVYFNLEWLEKAGQYWILTEWINDEKRIAIDAFKNSLGNSGYAILTRLKFKGEVDKLPVRVQNIYLALEEKSLLEVGYIPRYNNSEKTIYESPKETLKQKVSNIGCVILFITAAIIFCLGLINTINFIIK